MRKLPGNARVLVDEVPTEVPERMDFAIMPG